MVPLEYVEEVKLSIPLRINEVVALAYGALLELVVLSIPLRINAYGDIRQVGSDVLTFQFH